MTSSLFGQTIRVHTWQSWMGQWAELLQSGMPLLDALLLSIELQPENAQGRLLRQGLKKTLLFLNEGQTLQTAFRAAFGFIPSALDLALLCAQANGDLSTALREQNNRWALTTGSQQRLLKSLIYPGLVLFMAIACWVLLHQVSQPHLASTAIATPHGQAWANHLMITGVLVLLLALILRTRKNSGVKLLSYWAPQHAWIQSGFFHLIACELQAGLDLMHCLRCRTIPSRKLLGLIDTSSSLVAGLNRMVSQIHQQLKSGKALSQAMQEASAPGFMVRQSQLAEQTGNLAHCFALAAKVYELQALEAQARLQNIIPSVALAVAALLLAMAYQFTLASLYNNLSGF